MLIPYGTDAPISHFPWMTLVLIIGNVLTFSMTQMGSVNDGWVLTYGHGLHPLELGDLQFFAFGDDACCWQYVFSVGLWHRG